MIAGKGWGKLRTNGVFIGFWKLFGYLLLEIVIFTFAPDYLLPPFEEWLRQNSSHLLGIATGIFGTFFLWVVRAWGRDIRTQNKWVVPVVCYLITAANYWVAQ